MHADFDAINGLGKPVTARAKAQGVAQQFEDMMVKMFVGSMRETTKIGEDSEGLFGSGPGADTYTQWFDEKLTHEVTVHGHVGIAEVLMREFEQHNPAIAAAKAVAPAAPPAAAPTGLLAVDQRRLQPHRLPNAATKVTALPGGIDVTL